MGVRMKTIQEQELKNKVSKLIKGFPKQKYYTRKNVEDIVFNVLKIVIESMENKI